MAPKEEKKEKPKKEEKAEKKDKGEKKEAPAKAAAPAKAPAKIMKRLQPKRTKPTAAQEERKQTRLRKPKAWDVENRKKGPNGNAVYKNILAKYPEIQAQIQAGTFKVANLLPKKTRTPSQDKPKKESKGPKPAKTDRKAQDKWQFKSYLLNFGPYASKETLEKYFTGVPNTAAFVKTHFNEHINLSELIHKGRQRFMRRVKQQSRKAPETVSKTAKGLKELKSDAAFGKFLTTLLKADAAKICPLTQAYVVQVVRNGSSPDLKEKTLAFCQS